MEIYFDNSATTRVSDEVAQVVFDMMVNKYGNPSSLHSKGLEAELMIKSARETVAKALNVPPETLFFTSGGTEANNLAVFGCAFLQRRAGMKIVATAVEHASVLASLKELEKQGYEVVLISPDLQGKIEPDAIAERVDENTVLVSAMAVNNELGTIYNTNAIARAAKRKNPNVIVHCDAVQAFCKLPLRVGFGYTDIVTVSGHKIHAPKGVGAIYVNKRLKLPARAFGGSQETGIRPGTEAAALIAGFGEAVKLAQDSMSDNMRHIKYLNGLLQDELSKIDGVVFNSSSDALPCIINVSVPGVRSETMMHFLEDREIYVSSGSACSKGAKSHVLVAAGLAPEIIDSAIRISLSKYNTPDEVAVFAQAFSEGAKTIRKA